MANKKSKIGGCPQFFQFWSYYEYINCFIDNYR